MFNLIVLIVMAVMAACIAVMQWATGNRYRDTLWAWMCAYWVLQLIKNIVDIVPQIFLLNP